jgi:hypothetical protein
MEAKRNWKAFAREEVLEEAWDVPGESKEHLGGVVWALVVALDTRVSRTDD